MAHSGRRRVDQTSETWAFSADRGSKASRPEMIGACLVVHGSVDSAAAVERGMRMDDGNHGGSMRYGLFRLSFLFFLASGSDGCDGEGACGEGRPPAVRRRRIIRSACLPINSSSAPGYTYYCSSRRLPRRACKSTLENTLFLFTPSNMKSER